MKKVLILLSTYNGEKYLKEQLESLRNQTGVQKQYLIRDDGSVDGTRDILTKFSRKEGDVELILGENIGCAESFRFILNKAEKYLNEIDFIAFCDQDDIWLNNKLLVATTKLKKTSSSIPSMYCSNLFLTDKNGNILAEKRKRNQVTFSKGSSLVESIATGCTMVFNPETIRLFNKYPPKQFTLHDLWIFHLCVFFGEVIYDNDAYILYRQHENNVVGSSLSYFSKWKRRLKSLKGLSSQNYREKEAKEMLRVYNTILTEEDRKLLKLVADYKDDWSKRFRLLFETKNHSIKMSDWEMNFWLKIRIILGLV